MPRLISMTIPMMLTAQKPQNPHFFHKNNARVQTISNINNNTNTGTAHVGEPLGDLLTPAPSEIKNSEDYIKNDS